MKYSLGDYKQEDFLPRTNAFFALVEKAFPPEENKTPPIHGTIIEHFLYSRKNRMGICASRGIAKSRLVGNYTPLLIPMLGLGLGGRKKHNFIILISATFDNAVDMIQEIKDLYESMDDRYKKLLASDIWKADEISFKLADGETLSIVAMGAEGKIRGIRRKGYRPDALIFDDSEYEELVYNPDRMRKWKKWVTRSAIPAMTPDGVVLWIGTPLPNSLLGELQENDNWDFINLPIADEWGTPAWVDRFPAAWIEDKKSEFKDMGEINAWYQEFELKIIAEDEQIFKPEMMSYKSLDEIPEDLDIYIMCDLAISQATSADRTAFVVVGVCPINDVYVLEIFADRVSPSKQAGELLSMLNRWYKKQSRMVDALGMEKGALKQAFIDAWDRRLLDVSTKDLVKIPKIQELNPYTGKNAKNKRIQQLEPLFNRGKVHFLRGIKNIDMLEEELLSFPASKHDDVMDSFSYFSQLVKWREVKESSVSDLDLHYRRQQSSFSGISW